MDLVCIYQDANDREEYFSNTIGYDDAKNAVDYAMNIIKQPTKSAIYFAVDFNPSMDTIKSNIIPYFKGIKSVFEMMNVAYQIGVYGSGLVCSVIKEMGLADYTWLAQSTGYLGTAAYNDPTKYNIRQGCRVKLDNILFDSNASSIAKDFGQWNYK